MQQIETRLSIEVRGEKSKQESQSTPPRFDGKGYAKVELLHRMLVAQQLQQLEQRRRVQMALAKRRHDLEGN